MIPLNFIIKYRMKQVINTRDETIDIAKGIGIIAVVWGHIGEAFMGKNELFLFHMPLFFILSGYFFKDEGLTFIEVLKKRIQSYIIPYFIFLIIILTLFILLYVSIGYGDRIYLSLGIITHPYGVVVALWFLLSLFEVHIMYYFITKYIHKDWIKFILGLLCLITSHLIYEGNINIPFYIGSSLSMIIYFHLGYLIHKYRILNSSRYCVLIFIFCLLFYIGGILANIETDIMLNKVQGNLCIAFLAAIGGSYIILYISFLLKEYNKIPIINSILSYLGQNTLIIFSMHLLCIETARCLFNFPFAYESTFFDGVYTTIWGILGSLIIGIPIKKYIFPHIRIIKKQAR